MRVLALTNLYPNPYQPHRAPFNRQQFRALSSLHEIQVIAPIAWTTELKAGREGRAGAGLGISRQRVYDGLIVRHPRYFYTPRVLRSAYGQFFLESVRSCFQTVLEQFRPEVVLGCWAYPDGWAAVKLAREAGIPVVIKVQGSDLLTIAKQPARMERTREALSRADAIVAVSRDLASAAIAIGAPDHRVNVVYNGLDSTVFSPGPKDSARRELGLSPSTPLVLFAGNLVPVKGLDTLLDALARVSQSGIDFQCALVGSGPLKESLQQQASTLGLADRVRFVGPRPLDELPRWYRAADLVVLPSRSEGVPNVLLEATACGTPFIASRVGGIPEIAHSDSLVPAGDAIALAARISDVLTGRVRLMAHPTFRAHGWSESARDLSEVLRRVVSVHPLDQVARAG